MTSPLLIPVQVPTTSHTPSFSAGPSSFQKSLCSTGTSSSPHLVHFPKSDPITVREEGLPHANITLEARQYKAPAFAQRLLECLKLLSVPFWSAPGIVPAGIQIRKVSGALTNAVFFVSYPSARKSRTVLLRVYGVSSGCLVSRPRELHILHVLSSQYGIGPRVYGTFENGRVEEYFDSTTLTAADIRDPTISRWIGARMAELHSVDIEVVESGSKSDDWELGVKKNVKSWLLPAEEVLALPFVNKQVRAELDLIAFRQEWSNYLKWLSGVDDIHTGSARVFAHNDTQYGNLLRLQHPKDAIDEHRQACVPCILLIWLLTALYQLIVVDFEYAAPNPASFDIANHFHEWTANYHCSTPHLLDASRYPTYDERRNFYAAYISHTAISGELPMLDDDERELQLREIDQQVRYWSPASHAMWAIWGIVQAREDLEGDNAEPEFDYVGYSICRMAAFRREIRALGVQS